MGELMVGRAELPPEPEVPDVPQTTERAAPVHPTPPEEVEEEEGGGDADTAERPSEEDQDDEAQPRQQFVELMERNFNRLDSEKVYGAYAWSYEKRTIELKPENENYHDQRSWGFRMTARVTAGFVDRYNTPARGYPVQLDDVTRAFDDAHRVPANVLLSPLLEGGEDSMPVASYEGHEFPEAGRGAPDLDGSDVAKLTSLVKHADVTRVSIIIIAYKELADAMFEPLGGFVASSVAINPSRHNPIVEIEGGEMRIKADKVKHIIQREIRKYQETTHFNIQIIGLPRSPYASPYVLCTKTFELDKSAGARARSGRRDTYDISIDSVVDNIRRAATAEDIPISSLLQPGGVSTTDDMVSIASMGMLATQSEAGRGRLNVTTDLNARLRQAAILVHTRAAKEASLSGSIKHVFEAYDAEAHEADYENFKSGARPSHTWLYHLLLRRTVGDGGATTYAIPRDFTHIVGADRRAAAANACARMAAQHTPLFDMPPDLFEAVRVYSNMAFLEHSGEQKKSSNYYSKRQPTKYYADVVGRSAAAGSVSDMVVDAMMNITHSVRQAQMHASWLPEFGQPRNDQNRREFRFGWEWPYVCIGPVVDHEEPDERGRNKHLDYYKTSHVGLAHVYESAGDGGSVTLALKQKKFANPTSEDVEANRRQWKVSTSTSRTRAAMLLNTLVLTEGHLNILAATLQADALRDNLNRNTFDHSPDEQRRAPDRLGIAVALKSIHDTALPLNAPFLTSRRVRAGTDTRLARPVASGPDTTDVDELIEDVVHAMSDRQYPSNTAYFHQAMFFQYMKQADKLERTPADSNTHLVMSYDKLDKYAIHEVTNYVGTNGLFCPRKTMEYNGTHWMDGPPRYMRMYSQAKSGLRDDLVVMNDYTQSMYVRRAPKNYPTNSIISKELNMNPRESTTASVQHKTVDTSDMKARMSQWVTEALMKVPPQRLAVDAKSAGNAIADVIYSYSAQPELLIPSKLYKNFKTQPMSGERDRLYKPIGVVERSIKTNVALGAAGDTEDTLSMLPSAHLTTHDKGTTNRNPKGRDFYHNLRGQAIYVAKNRGVGVGYRHHVMWSSPVGSFRSENDSLISQNYGQPSQGQAHLWGDITDELLRLESAEARSDFWENRGERENPTYIINMRSSDDHKADALAALALRDALHHATLHARPLFEYMFSEVVRDVQTAVTAARALSKIITFACHMGNAELPNWMDFLRGDAVALVIGIASGAYDADHMSASMFLGSDPSDITTLALKAIPGVGVTDDHAVTPPKPRLLDVSVRGWNTKHAEKMDILRTAPLAAYRTVDVDTREYEQESEGTFVVSSISRRVAKYKSRNETFTSLMDQTDAADATEVWENMVADARNHHVGDHAKGTSIVSYHAMRTAYGFHRRTMRTMDGGGEFGVIFV